MFSPLPFPKPKIQQIAFVLAVLNSNIFQSTHTQHHTSNGKVRETTGRRKRRKKIYEKNEDRHRAVVVKQQSEVRKRNDTRVTNYFIRHSGSKNKNSQKSEIKWNFQPTKAKLKLKVFFFISSRWTKNELKIFIFSSFLVCVYVYMCICQSSSNRKKYNIIFISDEKNLFCFNLKKKKERIVYSYRLFYPENKRKAGDKIYRIRYFWLSSKYHILFMNNDIVNERGICYWMCCTYQWKQQNNKAFKSTIEWHRKKRQGFCCLIL